MDEYNNEINQEDEIIRNLEYRITNNEFTNKEELFNYMLYLRTSGVSQLDSKNIRELLNLYDSINEQQEKKNKNTLTRVRKRNFYGNPGNAAFTKVGLLIINIITFALLITTIILLKK